MFTVALMNFGMILPFGRILNVLISPTGMIGTLAAKANLIAPVLPLWSQDGNHPEYFCQAAILHSAVECSTLRRLYHWRKYIAKEYRPTRL